MSNARSQLSQDGSEDRSRRQSGSTRVPDTLQRSSPGRRAIAAEVAPGTGPEADVPSWARKMTDLLPGLENLDTCRSAHWSTRALLSPNTPQSRNQSRASRAAPLQPLLTVADVAAALNVSVRTVRRLAASGALRTIRIGRAVRFRHRGRSDRRWGRSMIIELSELSLLASTLTCVGSRIMVITKMAA
jgi:excisionase family DNA binding protein